MSESRRPLSEGGLRVIDGGGTRRAIRRLAMRHGEPGMGLRSDRRPRLAGHRQFLRASESMIVPRVQREPSRGAEG